MRRAAETVTDAGMDRGRGVRVTGRTKAAVAHHPRVGGARVRVDLGTRRRPSRRAPMEGRRCDPRKIMDHRLTEPGLVKGVAGTARACVDKTPLRDHDPTPESQG